MIEELSERQIERVSRIEKAVHFFHLNTHCFLFPKTRSKTRSKRFENAKRLRVAQLLESYV